MSWLRWILDWLEPKRIAVESDYRVAENVQTLLGE